MPPRQLAGKRPQPPLARVKVGEVMIDPLQIRRNHMIAPEQIKRNIKSIDTDKKTLIFMLEMHARAVESTHKIQSPQEPYVYVLLDPRKPGDYKYAEYSFDFEPFYVGMGRGSRWKNHLQCKEGSIEKNELIWEIILSGSSFCVEFVYVSQCTPAVRKKEIEIIRTIGMASKHKGPLLNTNG